MLTILVLIALLAVLGIVIHRGAATPLKPPVFRVDSEDQGMSCFVARTPEGLEVFVPSGTKIIRDVTVSANESFQTTFNELGPGVLRIPRSSLKDHTGTPMPSDARITNVSISFQRAGQNDMLVFSWR